MYDLFDVGVECLSGLKMPNYVFVCDFEGEIAEHEVFEFEKIVSWGTEKAECPKCGEWAHRSTKMSGFSFGFKE